MSHFNNKTFTIREQPVVLCLASTTVAVWRQNTVLKMMCCLKSTDWNPDMLQNRAAEPLRCIPPSLCFQRGSRHLHNEGYYQAVAHCWRWDFQPNVASAAALCTGTTSVFSGQQEQILCSLIASSECWFESDGALFYPLYLFYFLKAQIPSTERTNCPHKLSKCSSFSHFSSF